MNIINRDECDLNNIKVTFIIIAFNIENYMKKSIRSVINQSLKEIEIIIVDDGSHDLTLKNIYSEINGDDRVKVITQKNEGANQARKKGLQKAEGKYIVFVDGDDWVDKNLAYELYNMAEEQKVDIISYNFYKVYNDRQEINKDNTYLDICGERYLELILQQKITHNIWNKFIRKSFIDKTEINNMIGITMGDDLVANFELGIQQPKVIMTDKAYYFYYQREDSVTNKSSLKALEIKKSLEYIEKRLKETRLYDCYKEELEFLWIIHCYLVGIVLTRMEIDSIHRKHYLIWKEQKININKNKVYLSIKNKQKKSEKILISMFNLNYYLGILGIKLKRYIKKSIKYYRSIL